MLDKRSRRTVYANTRNRLFTGGFDFLLNERIHLSDKMGRNTDGFRRATVLSAPLRPTGTGAFSTAGLGRFYRFFRSAFRGCFFRGFLGHFNLGLKMKQVWLKNDIRRGWFDDAHRGKEGNTRFPDVSHPPRLVPPL